MADLAFGTNGAAPVYVVGGSLGGGASTGQQNSAASSPVVLASDQSAISVYPVQGTNPTTSQVSVAATATQILAAYSAKTPREIKNISAVTVFVGAAGVTTTTGHALLANEAFTPWWTGAVFGIVATGTATVTTCV